MSRASSELDRLRRAFGYAPNTDTVGDLPDSERIWRAATGEAEPKEVEALADLAALRPEVAHEWRLARELIQASEIAPFKSRGKRFLAPLLAAAAVLMVAIVPFLWRQAPKKATVYRGGDTIELLSESRQDDCSVRTDCVLRWTDLGGDAIYSVTVMTVELEVLAQEGGLDRPVFSVPGDSLTEPGRLLWRVQATLEDGRNVASDTFVTVVE